MGRSRALILCCFLLSGFTALIYQIVWARMLMSLLGSSAYGVAAVLGVFMAGLGIGAAVAARLPEGGNTTPPLRLYGFLELGIALYALCVPILFSQQILSAIFVNLHGSTDSAVISVLLRLAFAFVILVVPTALMGATLPVLSRFVHRLLAGNAPAKFGPNAESEVGMLYTINLLGAVIGVFLAGFVLLPTLGLTATCIMAGLVNLAVGGTVLALSFKTATDESAVVEEPVSPHPFLSLSSTSAVQDKPTNREDGVKNGVSVQQPARRIPIQRLPVILAFISGLLFMLMELGWTRMLSMILGSSVYSFTGVVGLCLLGIACGASLASQYLKYFKQPLIMLSAMYLLTAILLVCVLYGADSLPWLYLSTYSVLIGDGAVGSFPAAIAARLLLTAIVVLPAISAGAGFPLLLKAAELNDPLETQKKTGVLFSANTFGAVLGALLGGFVLIPLLSEHTVSGVQSVLLLAAANFILVSFIVAVSWFRSFIDDVPTQRIISGFTGFILLAVALDIGFFRPSWNQAVMSSGPMFYEAADVKKMSHDSFLSSLGLNAFTVDTLSGNLLFYKEGLNSTVTVGMDPARNVTFLKTDGKVEAALPADTKSPSKGSDANTQTMLALLPMCLHREPVHKVLVIGFGSGTTTGAVLSFPDVENVKVAELEKVVLQADRFFRDTNFQALESPKLTVDNNDGRFVLLTDPGTYDVIISQPADPWVSGAANLFTFEFWKDARSRLNPNGIYSQWIQLYSITPEAFGVLCNTFQTVFPNCWLVHNKGAGEVILLGTNGDQEFDWPGFEARLSPELKQKFAFAGIETANMVKLDPPSVRLLAQSLANGKLNTDDNLYLEFSVGKTALSNQQNISTIVDYLRKYSWKRE